MAFSISCHNHPLSCLKTFFLSCSVRPQSRNTAAYVKAYLLARRVRQLAADEIAEALWQRRLTGRQLAGKEGCWTTRGAAIAGRRWTEDGQGDDMAGRAHSCIYTFVTGQGNSGHCSQVLKAAEQSGILQLYHLCSPIILP